MASRSKPLSATSTAVLKLIAEGYTYEQILSSHPALTYLHIFEAAREALDVAGGMEHNYDRRLAEIRRVSPRAYQPWTVEEDAQLVALVQAGQSVDRIAEHLQRQPSAINSRIVRLQPATRSSAQSADGLTGPNVSVSSESGPRSVR
jgi:hypothetical protein